MEWSKELEGLMDDLWSMPQRETWHLPEVEDARKIKTTRVGSEFSTGNKCCAGRALALAEGISMAEADEYLMTFTSYAPNKGIFTWEIKRIMIDLGWTFTPARVRINSATAKDKLPSRAVLLFTRHIAFYEDGSIYDTYTTGDVAGSKETVGYFTKDA